MLHSVTGPGGKATFRIIVNIFDLSRSQRVCVWIGPVLSACVYQAKAVAATVVNCFHLQLDVPRLYCLCIQSTLGVVVKCQRTGNVR